MIEGRLCACLTAGSRSSMAIPNLFSFSPVVILAWVCASTLGLTRKAMVALTPRASANWLMMSNSGRLSTLKQEMPCSNARFISQSLFPTPAKTIFICWETSVDGCLDFASAHAVGSQAVFRDDGEDVFVGVGFYGVVNVEILIFSCFFLDCCNCFFQKVEVVIVEGRFDGLEALNGGKWLDGSSFWVYWVYINKSNSMKFHTIRFEGCQLAFCFSEWGYLLKSSSLNAWSAAFLSDSLTRKEMLWLLPPYEIMRKGISESAFCCQRFKANVGPSQVADYADDTHVVVHFNRAVVFQGFLKSGPGVPCCQWSARFRLPR